MVENLYCAYENLNPAYNKEGNIVHPCKSYGTALCNKCSSRFDGERINNYMEEHPKVHEG